MERLIIQQERRHGRISEFVKSSGDSLSLGRGYDNDVILSDVYIGEKQLRFDYEQGQWLLTVLDDTNPVLVNDKAVGEEPIAIKSGDRLIIGRTHLVLLLSHHPVERTRKLVLSNWMYHRILGVVLPLLMLLVSALSAVFPEYQASTAKIIWGQIAASGLAYMFVIAFWAGCWALVGRLLGHKPHYFVQLYYTALVMAVLNFAGLFSGYTEYATTSQVLGYLVEWGFMLFILTMLLKFNLSYATELKKKGTIAFSVVAVSMLFTLLMENLGQRDFSTSPSYSDTVKPPLAKWSSDSSVDAYMHNFALKFDELEQSLEKEKKNQ